MKKILIFSLAYYPDNVSGAEVAIKETTDRIAPEDITFHMVTLRFGSHAVKEEKVGNVYVHRIGVGGAYLSKMLFVPLAAFKARSLHKQHRFDGVWTMMTYMLLPTMLTRVLGIRIPYVLTLQDGDSYDKVFKRWFIRPVAPILDWGFRRAAVVQAISHYLATWPAKRGYRGVVEVVPNGASLQSAAEIPETELAALKTGLHKKEGEVFLVSVSRLVHQKAIDVVIRAVALLPEHIRYIVVGDGEDRPMLENLVKELKLEKRVTFVGKVERDMTAKYRRVSDIFVLPSRSEGQGISFASTMVSGLPMIATQEGGIADFLFDAKRDPDKPTTGWAVDVDNPEQIAEAVLDILAHPEKAKEVAETARKYALENFDWDAIAKRMREKVFSTALAR